MVSVGIMADDDNIWLLDDDDEEFLAAWDEADRQAAELLRSACEKILTEPAPELELQRAGRELRAGVEAGRWPFEYFLAACGWGRRPDGDAGELWLEAAAATISPPNDPETDAELQSAVYALEHADWFGMVVGIVRRGVGAKFAPDAVERDIATCPEVDASTDDLEGDLGVLSTAVAVLAPLWQGLGILDDHDRLTNLGRWGLPRALLVTWEHEDEV